MDRVTESVLGAFDFTFSRCLDRMQGMSDSEYVWEPAPGCWSIRESSIGFWTLDGAGGPVQDPAPLTTIAWRTCHVGGQVLGGFANWLSNAGSPLDGDPEIPDTAVKALAYIDRNFQLWRDGMTSFAEDRLWTPIGAQFGEFAGANAVDLMLHVLDEFIHHAAEIALLRDLYAQLGQDA